MGAPAFVHYDEKARRTADAMIATEARHIAQRKAQEQACKCKDGMFPGAGLTDRRKFLFAAGSLAGVIGLTGVGPAGGTESAAGRHPFRRAGGSNQGAGPRGRGRRRLRLALAIRDGGALALSDSERAYLLEHDAARQDARQSHAVGPAFRTPSRRHPDHRSGQA